MPITTTPVNGFAADSRHAPPDMANRSLTIAPSGFPRSDLQMATSRDLDEASCQVNCRIIEAVLAGCNPDDLIEDVGGQTRLAHGRSTVAATRASRSHRPGSAQAATPCSASRACVACGYVLAPNDKSSAGQRRQIAQVDGNLVETSSEHLARLRSAPLRDLLTEAKDRASLQEIARPAATNAAGLGTSARSAGRYGK